MVSGGIKRFYPHSKRALLNFINLLNEEKHELSKKDLYLGEKVIFKFRLIRLHKLNKESYGRIYSFLVCDLNLKARRFFSLKNKKGLI